MKMSRRKRADRHHLWFIKADYVQGGKRSLKYQFRTLPCHIVKMDRMAHELLHKYTTPPEMPSEEDMRAAIQRHRDRHCGCYE